MTTVGQAVNPSLPPQNPRQTPWAPLPPAGPEQPHPPYYPQGQAKRYQKCSDYFLEGSISSLSAWATLGALSSIR